MSEEKNLANHDPGNGGIISGTIPSLAEIVLPIFGGCCCVLPCDDEQENVEKNRTDPATGEPSMAGGPCCPELEPSNPAGKGDGEENDDDEEPSPKTSGLCEEIKLQVNLHGNIYLNFAFAFEPILDIPPGLPSLPSIGLPLFGIPNLNLPGIPLPPFPGLNLPGFPLPAFGLDISIPGWMPSIPGLPFFTMTLFPIGLGLDLFKLKLPDIPDFDLCAIAKFIGQLPPDADCDLKLPTINPNIPLCYLTMLLFFLMLIQPLLAVLLGMKEKGMMSVDESRVDSEDPTSRVPTPPVIESPPRISIVHEDSAETEDGSLMIFKVAETVDVMFTLTPFELVQLFGPDSFFSEDGSEITEETPGSVRRQGLVFSRFAAVYKWTVHGPDGSIKEKSNESPSESDYPAAFNAFKNALSKPKSLEQRKIHEITHPASSGSRGRFLRFNFENEGLYEVYCTITIGETSKEMVTFVQIGKPKLVKELPPILKAMPKVKRKASDDNVVTKSTKVTRPDTPPPQPPAQPEADKPPAVISGTPKKGI